MPGLRSGRERDASHTRGVPPCPQPRDRQKRPGIGRDRYHGQVNAVLMARSTIAPAAAARVGQEGKPGIRLWSDATWAEVADANLVRPDKCAVIVFGFINALPRIT